MGATFISMKVNSTERYDILQAFENQKKQDRKMYGNYCYNGSFSTIDTVKIHNVTFGNERDACEYCLHNAEKWDYAVAVTVDNGKEKPYTFIGGWGAE